VRPQVYRFTRRLTDLFLCAPLVAGGYGFSAPIGNIATFSMNAGSPTADVDLGINSVSMGFGSQYTLQNCPTSSDLITLFKEYRIVNVKLEIQTMSHLNENTPNIYSLIPQLIIAEDDTTNAPPSLLQALNFQGSKRYMLLPERALVFSGRPKPAVYVYGQSTSSDYALPNTNDLWFNCSTSADVPHYLHVGVVRNLNANASGNNLAISFGGELTLEFRRPW
jgi:hypothetical protein